METCCWFRLCFDLDNSAASGTEPQDDKDLPKTELVAQLLQAERRRKQQAAITQKEREIQQRQASLAALLEADKLGYQARFFDDFGFLVIFVWFFEITVFVF